MPNNEKDTLAEYLSKDSEGRAFFAELSPKLRAVLLKKDISAFEHLRSCSETYGSNSKEFDEECYNYYNPACSANDCTGLIPTGSDKTAGDFDEFKELYPFSVPPQS